MQAQAYGWPLAPVWGVGDVVSGTDPTDLPLTSSVKALGGTQKKLISILLAISNFAPATRSPVLRPVLLFFATQIEMIYSDIFS